MSSKIRTRNRRVIGRGIKDWMSKANDFLKITKLLSSIGSTLNSTIVPEPFRQIGQKVIDYGKSKGYGRRKIRRRVRGHGLRLAGGGLNPVGSGGMMNNHVFRRLPSYF